MENNNAETVNKETPAPEQPAVEQPAAPVAVEGEKKPFYKKGWFWIAAVVVAAVVGAGAAIAVTSKDETAADAE